jgi:hypothetical protein
MVGNTSTLRPGLLVSLKTSTRGNVAYDKRDIEADHLNKKGERVAKWETTRQIADPEEFARAAEVRSKACSLIRGVCSWSAFGLLCPEADGEELDKAIAAATELTAQFNRTAKITRVSVNVLKGRIAPDDVEAVKAINSEIRDLMSEMETGLQNLDVKQVRAAAQKAKGIGNMLTPNAQARIQIAIDLARKSAIAIVKAGETAAQEIDRATIRKIKEQRTAFLELDEPQEIAKPKVRARAVELDAAVQLGAEYEQRLRDGVGTNEPTTKKRKSSRQLQFD